MATLDYFNHSVSILEGNGEGLFTLLKSYAVGNNPRDMVIGDFDGDNKQDIITANGVSNDMSFLKGKGNFDFENSITFSGFDSPTYLDTGDFNKDGIVDLIGGAEDNIFVFWGSKKFFGTKMDKYTLYGGISKGIAAADFDSDGNLDIAHVNYARFESCQEVIILKGHGDESFELTDYWYPLAGTNSFYAIATDFNNDSKPDFAVVNRVDNSISVFMNSYTYVEPTSTPIPTLKPTITPTPTNTTTTPANTPKTDTPKTDTPKTDTPKNVSTPTPSPVPHSGSNRPSEDPVQIDSPTAISTATPTPEMTSSSPTATPTTTTVLPTITPSAVENFEDKPASGVLKDILNHWAKDQILELIKQNTISGYQDGNFKPDNNITGAELAVIIVKALNLELSQGNTEFKDDKDLPDWAKDYIKAAVENGIISGYSDGTFKPSKPCTRQETVVMLMNAFKFGKSDASIDLIDSQEIAKWSKAYVVRAIELGILKGYENKTFRPEKNVSRAEAVVMIVNSIHQKD